MTDLSHEPHSNADLKSEVERLKVELKEAQAAAAVMREALEFYGDPETYFAIAMLCDPPCGEFLEDVSDTGEPYGFRHGKRARETLESTTAVTALLARMAEAERLIEKNNSHHGESAAWNGLTGEPLNRAAMLIVENDAWLKGGVK